MGATLALFEDVYYGRRSPTARQFESVWIRARRSRSASGRWVRECRDETGSTRMRCSAGRRGLCDGIALGFAGCGPGLDATYGKSRGTSLNGTSVFAQMLRDQWARGADGDPAQR